MLLAIDFADVIDITYWTVQELLSLVATLLHVALEQSGVEWFEQLKATEKLAGHGHNRAPIIKLSTVLSQMSAPAS